jgi:hypothetical protein
VQQSEVTGTMKGMRGRWLDAALVAVFVVLFVGLRWWSGLWAYRWTGFSFGLTLGLFGLRGIRTGLDISRRYDIPRRVHLVGSVVFTAMGTVTLKHFLPNGGSDDGFFGVVLLALAIKEALVYYRFAGQDNAGFRAENQGPKLNHG